MPPRRQRVDAELVRRGLARSREEAARLVTEGRVTSHRVPIGKPATTVASDAPLVVRDDESDPGYASRGGHKLAGALDVLGPRGLTVSGRRCLDAGASTGGFTDVLLRRGAVSVAAVDVGYGQLVWRLRQDARVEVYDRTNIRTLTLERLGEAVDLVVADLSFISLSLVLPALTGLTRPGSDLLLMVKPQFEVGRDRVGKGGVVRDPGVRRAAVSSVADTAAGLGWPLAGVARSPLPGPAGNVELFCWMRAGATPMSGEQLTAEVDRLPPATGEKVDP